ncbi:MAG: hypothetical protein ABSD62_10530 [Candidatus Limnocylindrales bacterium]
MRCRLLSVLGVILLLSVTPGSALGAATLDQSNTAGPVLFAGGGTYAQTITVGVTGTLTRIDLYVSDSEPGGGKIVVQIEGVRRVAGFPPNSTPVATGLADVSTDGWYTFNLSPAISLLAGGRFAVVASFTGTQGFHVSGDAYPGGQFWGLSGSTWSSVGPYDVRFKTYMNVPSTPIPTSTPTPAPTPKATPTHGATPSPGTAATPTAASSATAAPSGSTASAAVEITSSPSPAEGTSAPPTASAAPGGGPALGGGTDWTLPVALVAFALLALAAGVGGFLLARRRRRKADATR